MATLTPPRRAARLWRGRAVTLAVVGVLLAFSPRVGYLLSGDFNTFTSAERAGPALPPPEPPAPSAALLARYAQLVPSYLSALAPQHPSVRRQTRLLEAHFRLYRQARALIGVAQADALLHLLALETRNQDPARQRASVFGSPEAALDNAARWLGLIHQVERTVPGPALDRQIAALAPVPMAPEVVRQNARWLRWAAADAHLPPAVLAAIVDNEQAGNRVAYGLAGHLRDLTDTVALRTTQMYGASGLAGRLSQTVGLSQMSWQDALLQRGRMQALGLSLGAPFPENEEGARDLLQRPAANLLFAASRLVGYLNFVEGVRPDSATPHTDAWVYFLGPGWHNNPALASSGQVWPYAWNAFFKACLYQRLLER